jgi:N-acylneuraminate cytidylyltransferase
MKTLFLIPARAGSKGLPGKNTKLLGNKALIEYSIDFALENMLPDDILCVSTNDPDVIAILKNRQIDIPFIRPDNLSNDTSGMHEVIEHALLHYKSCGIYFNCILLLQPTSPFRLKEDIKNIYQKFDSSIDMVVSVKCTKENPYFNLFEENEFGYLIKSKTGYFERRQDSPIIYAYNGSMYLINVDSISTSKLHELKKIKKIIMPEERSVDIDNEADWILTEFYLKKYENNQNNS